LTKEQFKIIYDQYFESIRKYIYYRSGDQELSTDVAQETFVKVWEKQFEYHPNKTKSLLYKIALEIFITNYRKQKNASTYLKYLKLNFIEANDENDIEYQELKSQYEKTLARLPEKQRDVFLMSRLENLTYKEIAERLNIGVKAVEKRMGLALSVLKKEIAHNEN
jgi:RNA polymerase sigma-70 factor (family 1)